MSIVVLNSVKNWDEIQNTHLSVLLVNPRLSKAEVALQKKTCEKFLNTSPELKTKKFIFISTSGTSLRNAGDYKIIVQTEDRFFEAANAVNNKFKMNSENTWLLALPTYHVAGLSILARAHLSGARVIHLDKWVVEDFVYLLSQAKKVWTSLVPAQIYDLVQAQHHCPDSVRGVFVGAGQLSLELHQQAVHLGWPLVLSYGMTETCAMLASSLDLKLTDLQSLRIFEDSAERELQALDHVNLNVSNEGFLQIKSKSNLLAKIEVLNKIEKVSYYPDHFETEDQVELKKKHNTTIIKVLGRSQQFVKILGESVNVAQIRSQLAAAFNKSIASKNKLQPEIDFEVVALESEREGMVLCCCILEKYQEIIEDVKRSLQQNNQEVLPFQRITWLFCIEDFPKTELKKIKWNELKELAWKNMKLRGIKVSF